MKGAKYVSSLHIPEPSLAEIKASLPKTDTIHLRLTTVEKEEIRATAKGSHLTVTEYLLKCHQVVLAKLRKDR
jgi:hypothetical protein